MRLRTKILAAAFAVIFLALAASPALAAPYCCPRSNGGICCSSCQIKTAEECPGDYDFKACEPTEAGNPCPGVTPAPSATVSVSSLPGCNNTTFSPGITSFVACCPLGTSNSCADCCRLDAAHSGDCPAGKFLKPECAVAAGDSGAPPARRSIALPNPLQTPYLQVAIGNLARVLLGIAGSIALAVFVWGGVMLITSAGDTKKVDQGRKMMVWTAIGLAVMFGAEAIVRTLLGAILGSQ